MTGMPLLLTLKKENSSSERREGPAFSLLAAIQEIIGFPLGVRPPVSTGGCDARFSG